MCSFDFGFPGCPTCNRCNQTTPNAGADSVSSRMWPCRFLSPNSEPIRLAITNQYLYLSVSLPAFLLFSHTKLYLKLQNQPLSVILSYFFCPCHLSSFHISARLLQTVSLQIAPGEANLPSPIELLFHNFIHLSVAPSFPIVRG